jgi:hypothetical protein
MKKQILIFGLTTLLASATRADQQQLASSIRDVHDETSRTSEQLKATLGALNGLTKQSKGDLRPAYDVFVAQVAKTQAAAASTAARVQWMHGDGQQYFKDWQNTITSISNEDLRKRAQKRMDSVRSSYDKVGVSLKEASEKFKPFLSNLEDIQKALATDVTAGGVKAIRSVVKDANWNHDAVNDSIESALKEMNRMEKALSSQAE